MSADQTTILIDRSTGEITEVPEALARKADKRAFDVFLTEARFGRTFEQCLGQVYLVGLKVGLEIANG